MDILERGYYDNFETAFDSIAEEMKGIRNALERIAVALQPKQEAPKQPDQLALPITALGVSVRAINVLITNKCRTIGDVTALTKFRLRASWACGAKTVKEIETALAKRGLKLAR